MSWVAEHWQDVVVAVVLLAAVGYMVRRIVRSLGGRSKHAGCDACPSSRLDDFASPPRDRTKR